MTRYDAGALSDVVSMLPLGVAALLSGFGTLAALAAILGALLLPAYIAWLGVLWACVAACIGIDNARRCIAAMTEGSWRAVAYVGVVSGALIVSCPLLWPVLFGLTYYS